MDLARRYASLKAEAERLRSEADRRAGAEDSLMKRLKDEYGLKSLAAAEKEISRLEGESRRLEEEAEEKLDEAEGLLDKP